MYIDHLIVICSRPRFLEGLRWTWFTLFNVHDVKLQLIAIWTMFEIAMVKDLIISEV